MKYFIIVLLMCGSVVGFSQDSVKVAVVDVINSATKIRDLRDSVSTLKMVISEHQTRERILLNIHALDTLELNYKNQQLDVFKGVVNNYKELKGVSGQSFWDSKWFGFGMAVFTMYLGSKL